MIVNESNKDNHSITLEPCPFCGSTDIRLVENMPDDPAWSSTYIECKKCHASNQYRLKTTADALTWWNSRAKNTEEKYMVFQKDSRQGLEWDQESIELSLKEAKEFIEFHHKLFPDNQYCIMTEVKE